MACTDGPCLSIVQYGTQHTFIFSYKYKEMDNDKYKSSNLVYVAILRFEK